MKNFILIVLTTIFSLSLYSQDNLKTTYTRNKMSNYNVVNDDLNLISSKTSTYHIDFFVSNQIAIYEQKKLIYAFRIMKVIEEKGHKKYIVVNETSSYLKSEEDKLKTYLFGDSYNEGFLLIFNDHNTIAYRELKDVIIFE